MVALLSARNLRQRIHRDHPSSGYVTKSRILANTYTDNNNSQTNRFQRRTVRKEPEKQRPLREGAH